MEERLSKHRRFQHLSYGGQDVPKLRLSYQAIQLSSSYANFHPHVHRFFGCCIYRCTPILPDNNMLHSPLGFPIRISCGMIGLLLSPSFLDIFTYRLLKADFDIHPYGRTFFSFVAWFHLLQRESRLRARQGGFAVAPLTPSQRTPMFLDFYCYRRNLRLQARLGQRCFWRFLRIFPLLDLDECGIILFRDEDEPRCAANFSFWLTRMKRSVASLRQVE